MYRIALYRANGRFVKYLGPPCTSKYKAKQRIPHYESKYDGSYYFEVERV